MRYPSISIVTVSYNTSLSIWRRTLQALHDQDYPTSKIEHIIMDAGSTNGSLELLRRQNAKVFVEKTLLDNPLKRMKMALSKAKNEIILFLEPDNIMIGKHWLRQMVLPFLNNKKVVGTFSMHNAYDPSMPAFTKYCSLFGINDPVVYYLNKSEKLPLFETTYKKGILINRNKEYTTVSFDKRSLPTLGDNGHMVRRKILNKVIGKSPNFLHTDAFMKLLELGHNTYGVVHNSIIHYTGSNILSFFLRRIEYKKRDFDGAQHKRAYLVYDSRSGEDKKNLVLYVIYSLTFIQPLYLSVKGYLTVQDPAWFLHPIICFLGLIAYGYSEIRNYCL
ncbi:MAG TPA: glycosyltransferase [Patescibacteria group bacterium]|nr:glycosyltransferase [Patescibacteria group bacterium]